MSRSRALIVLALAVSTAAGAPAFAAKPKKLPAPKPLTIVDQASDANGINSQGDLAPIPNQAGPGRTAADILSVSLGRIDNGKKVLGLTATFVLSAAPDQGTLYRLQASTPTCALFWLAFNIPLGSTAATGTATLREDCAVAGTLVTTALTATITDKTIVIAAPFTAMPAIIKVGTPITSAYGETRGHLVAATAPVIDETVTSPDTYKVGS